MNIEANRLAKIVDQMKSDTVQNYVIAGLDSHLLNAGKVRMFECSRDHQDSITPHSHRYDFACLVLAGEVKNRVWFESSEHLGDFFESSEILYTGEIGKHRLTAKGRGHYSYKDASYTEGEVYRMNSDQIHSIKFSRGAKVLFFEGPEIRDSSLIIEPVVNGKVIRTYEQREYMFLKSEAVR